MRVLIVKMSSMGDIIHTLPSISDAANVVPQIQFDWVVEEAFTEIPLWHTAVKKIIPIGLRRWRKHIWQSLKANEVRHFYHQLREEHYDIVLDAQGSIKSALTTLLSHGYRLGLDKKSVREHFANLAYQKSFSAPWGQHAIDRLRQLFAQAFNYTLPNSSPNYGIDLKKLPKLQFESSKPFVLFVPNTSWPAKMWPEEKWLSLANKVTERGLQVLIPWGNTAEKEKVSRLCGRNPNIRILPQFRLAEIATLLLRAEGAVCVDTGLSHLAAALNTPTITLYGPTDSKLIGTVGHLQQHFPLHINVEAIYRALFETLR